MSLGGPIRFNTKGQVEGTLSASMQIRGGRPTVVLPRAFAEMLPVFPAASYRKT